MVLSDSMTASEDWQNVDGAEGVACHSLSVCAAYATTGDGTLVLGFILFAAGSESAGTTITSKANTSRRPGKYLGPRVERDLRRRFDRGGKLVVLDV